MNVLEKYLLLVLSAILGVCLPLFLPTDTVYPYYALEKRNGQDGNIWSPEKQLELSPGEN